MRVSYEAINMLSTIKLTPGSTLLTAEQTHFHLVAQ
jgi:hypothetical protein